VVLAYSKCPVKTGLAMALPPGCYSRTAPTSGLALKKFIDVGVGVVDSDYRGELGVVVFNFNKEDFVVNMGDKIAQLIFEKIKTPAIKEMGSLDGTEGDAKGYGSTRMNNIQSNQVQDSENK
ncbi:MAG: dUTP diphosphatase, partial [Cytophagales bacterium]|nr:dUTP diphosphatase [Cytophagales bacterium]